MAKPITRLGRMDKEMWNLVRKVQAMAIMQGKELPTTSEATKIIAQMAKTSEGMEMLNNLSSSFIPFKVLKRKKRK